MKTYLSKDGALTLSLPASAPDPIASVIKVDVKGEVPGHITLTIKK